MEGGSGSRSSLVIPTAPCQPMAVLSCLMGKEAQVEDRPDWQLAKELHWSLVNETPAPERSALGRLGTQEACVDQLLHRSDPGWSWSLAFHGARLVSISSPM